MFQFKNGRFYPAVIPQIISFKVPEGLWLDTEPSQTGENLITFRSGDGLFEATLHFGTMQRDAVWDEMEAFLEEIEEDPEDGERCPVIRKAECAGFAGCEVTCMGGAENVTYLDLSSFSLRDYDGNSVNLLEYTVSAIGGESADILDEVMDGELDGLISSLIVDGQA